MKKIKLIVSDIDGVLTDGRITLSHPYDSDGTKTLCFKDFDAVGMLKDIGVNVCLITGEKDGFVDEVIRRFNPKICISGCKDKALALEDISKKMMVAIDEMAYMGDGKYDIPALQEAGLSICPMDAIQEVKNVSDVTLEVNGGYGCLAAAYTIINKYNSKIDSNE